MGLAHTPSPHAFRPAPIDLSEAASRSPIRSIPELIQYNADVNPDATFGYQAVKRTRTRDDDESNDGLASAHSLQEMKVTMLQLRNAVWHCARRLEAEVNAAKRQLNDRSVALVVNVAETQIYENKGTVTGSPERAPVALFMDSDLSLLIHLFALLTLGVPVMLLSVRLSSVAVRHLLETTGAHTIIASPRHVEKIRHYISDGDAKEGHTRGGGRDGGVGSRISAKVLEAVSFQHDLTNDNIPAQDASIFTREHFVDEHDRNVLILHSSGTTGLPKAIYQPHKYLLGYATCHMQTENEEVEGLNMTTLPLYHGFGLVVPCLALGVGKPFWIPPAHIVPDGKWTTEALRQTGAKSLMTVPHILDEICGLGQEEYGIPALLPLQFVACGGGPLRHEVAERLATSGVKLVAHFGTTETGPLSPVFVPGPEDDWRFWRLRPDIPARVESVMVEDGADTSFKIGPGETAALQRLTVTPFGWDESFVLQDRLLTSERLPGREFRAIGRTDDMIVLVTGEKVQPHILESVLRESPLVKDAVAFGNGQFELGVIVEPVVVVDKKRNAIEGFKEAIWPLVVEANNRMDSHARISSKASVVVLHRGQTLPRSDKGAVLRRAVNDLFEAEIRSAYEDIEHSVTGTDTPGSTLDVRDLEESLMNLVRTELSSMGHIANTLQLDADLFERGIDSLQAMRIRRMIQRTSGDNPEFLSREKIERDFVHRNPTVRRMAEALRRSETTTRFISEEKMIEDYVSQYSLTSATKVYTILLTGSTGSIGSHVLSRLVSNPAVAKVICLRRHISSTGNASHSLASEDDPASAQIGIAKSKGAIIPQEYLPKIEILHTDPHKSNLGLSEAAYLGLRQDVTHIVHAGWPMDFQRGLSSFEDQFQLMHNLLALACDAAGIKTRKQKPRLLFISSIAVVGRYHSARGSRIVPEEYMDHMACSNDFGYARAKLVCEWIVKDAAVHFGDVLDVATVRVGQVAGASDSGYWNPREHFPALVQMTQAVGQFPRLEGAISWLPLDLVASAISEILFTPGSLTQPAVYHIENPVRQDWQPILRAMSQELGFDRVTGNTEPMPFAEWAETASQRLSEDAHDNGAQDGEEQQDRFEMLRAFFEHDFQHMSSGGVILDTAKARELSPTLRNADKIEPSLAVKYIQEWKRSGFLK